MKYFFGFLGVFFLTGSIVNDAFLFSDESSLTWAKVLFLLGFICSFANGYKIEKISKYEFFLLMYVVVLLLLSNLSTGFGFSERCISISISLIIGLFSFSTFIRLNIKSDIIVKCFVFWALISVFIGLVQTFSGRLFFTDRIFLSTVYPSLYRASGLMSDPNYFGLICLVALSLTNSFSDKFFSKLMLVIGVFLSGSRSAMLSLILLFFFKRLLNSLTIKVVIASALLFIGFGFFLYYFSEYLPHSFAMVFDSESYGDDAERNSLQDRVIAINAAISAFYEYPLLGYGLGNLVYYPLNIHGQMSHNSYIELLAETGVLGFFSYFILVVYFLYKSKTFDFEMLKGDGRQVNLYPTSVLCLILFSIMSLTLVTYYSRIMFFVFSICFLLVREQENREIL